MLTMHYTNYYCLSREVITISRELDATDLSKRERCNDSKLIVIPSNSVYVRRPSDQRLYTICTNLQIQYNCIDSSQNPSPNNKF